MSLDFEKADIVIAKMGGVTNVAKLLGLSKGAVSLWKARKEKGGSNNSVPLKHRGKLNCLYSEIIKKK